MEVNTVEVGKINLFLVSTPAFVHLRIGAIMVVECKGTSKDYCTDCVSFFVTLFCDGGHEVKDVFMAN